MDRWIARDDGGVLDPNVAAREIGDHSTRLPNKQGASRNIPGRQLLFPEPVGSAGRWTRLKYSPARSAATLARCSKSNADTILRA